MKRVLSLYLPTWPTDRYRRKMGDAAPSPHEPLVLKGNDGNRQVLMAVDDNAYARKLRIGQPVTKANALVDGLIVKEFDPQGDDEALDKLASWALRYTPLVMPDYPDGLVMDTTGADHLFGGERAMLEDMLARLKDSGFAARAAIADTWGAAHAIARYTSNGIKIVPPGDSSKAILSLPVSALRLAANTVEALSTMGMTRISDVANKPRAPLALRFGRELGRRIDQAFGREHEIIDAVTSPEIIDVRRVFAEPIGAPETIDRYTRILIEKLCLALEDACLGARRLDLLFNRVDNRVETITIGTARPDRDVSRLSRLICSKIETIDPGFGIESMRLIASHAEPLEMKQTRSSFGEDEPVDVTGLVDILGNRFGAERLYRLEPFPSRVPERSVRRVPPTAPECGKRWTKKWPRPTRLNAKPQRIETMSVLPDYPPIFFKWQGETHRIKCADGPERIFGEWWMDDREVNAVRDYFRVEDMAGKRFWIFRAGDGEHTDTGPNSWWLHGVFG